MQQTAHFNEKEVYVSLSMGAAPSHRSDASTSTISYCVVILVVAAQEDLSALVLISSKTDDIKHFNIM